MRRKITFFEKALFIVGIAVALLGFFLINLVYTAHGKDLNFEMLIAVFLWLILIFQIVTASISENQKEETHVIDRELHQETKLMRELIKDNVLEIKLLRADLSALKKIDKDIKKKK